MYINQIRHCVAVALILVYMYGFAGEIPIDSYREILHSGKPQTLPIGINQASRTKGDNLPNLTRRPPWLRPGSLPVGVRYSFADDAIVINAAATLTNWLSGPSTPEQAVFQKSLLVQPGACKALKSTAHIDYQSASPWKFEFWNGNTNETLWGVLSRDPKEIEQTGTAIREDVLKRSGGTVRAMTTTEMKKWWVFIGFDIEEPTLVLETKDKQRHYIFGFVDNKIVLVDELDGLPDLQAQP